MATAPSSCTGRNSWRYTFSVVGITVGLENTADERAPEVGAYACESQIHATDGHRRREHGEPGRIGVLEPGERMQVHYLLRIMRD